MDVLVFGLWYLELLKIPGLASVDIDMSELNTRNRCIQVQVMTLLLRVHVTPRDLGFEPKDSISNNIINTKR